MRGARRAGRIAGRGALLVYAILAAAGCADRREQRLQQWAPETPRELIHHLVHDSDLDFDRYCDQVGLQRLLQAHLDILRAGRGTDPGETAARFRWLAPYVVRIGGVLDRAYGYPASGDRVAWMRTLTAQQLDEWYALRARQEQLIRTQSGDPQEEQAKALELEARFEALGFDGARAALLGYIADVYATHGDREQHERWLRRSIAAARQTHVLTQLCQQLGVMGVLHESRAQYDSMAVCWDEALSVAQRIRHAEQAGRITTFYADHFRSQGRLELAQQWFEDSARLCREYKGESIETRYVLRAARFYAELGCWDIVDRHLQRARKLLDDPQLLADAGSLRLYRFDAQLLAAWRQMSLGEVDDASARFAGLARSVEELRSYHDRWSELHWRWAEGLVQHGRPDQAGDVAQAGLDVARRHNEAVLESRLWLVMARVALAKHALGTCRQHLERFTEAAAGREESLRREWVGHDALAVSASLAAGDSAAARQALAAGMHRLRAVARATDASPAGYLFLDSCRELRLAGHAAWAGLPEQSLRFDREWRGLVELLQPRDRAGAAAVPAPARADQPALSGPRSGGPSWAAPGSITLQYLIEGDAVVRWTLTAAGIREERLELDPRALEQRVRALVEQLQSDHGDRRLPIERELADLGSLLLPPEVLRPAHSGAPPPVLCVAPDGALGLLPFGALGLAGDSYRPVLARFDVVTDRCLGPPARSPDGTIAVVVADPRVGEGTRVGARVLDLPGSQLEAARWAAAQPHALVLADTGATRANLQAVWQRANSLYFAAHVVQNPELPYLQLIPLADSRATPGATNLLGVTEIRRADLSRCRLVVLSACHSGVHYVGGSVQGPSLAEAFLDAGAASVVQTLWAVRDQGAQRLMGDFARAWATHPVDIVSTLNASLRRWAVPSGSTVGDDRRPFEWAAYGVQVRDGWRGGAPRRPLARARP